MTRDPPLTLKMEQHLIDAKVRCRFSTDATTMIECAIGKRLNPGSHKCLPHVVQRPLSSSSMQLILLTSSATVLMPIDSLIRWFDQLSHRVHV